MGEVVMNIDSTKNIFNYIKRYHNSKIISNTFDITSMLYTINFENGEKTFIGLLAIERFDVIKPSYKDFEKDYRIMRDNMKEWGWLK